MGWRFLAILACSLASAPVWAGDWPQWRGPQRTGVSTETGLLKEWPEAGPQLAWQSNDVGEGYGTPSVVGKMLYLQSSDKAEEEYILAIDTSNQQKIWRTRIGGVGANQGPQYPGSRGTPTIDGELMYAIGSDGDFVCLETTTGKIRWQKSFRNDFDGKPGAWAYSESPLVDGPLVVGTPGGKDAAMVALDKKSGEVVWRTANAEGDQAGYSSIITVETAGVKQYVQFLQKGLVGVDGKTGELLWKYARSADGSSANIPTPIARGNFVFSSTNQGGAGLVELKADQGKFAATQVYFTKKMPSAIGGAVEVENNLYGTNSQGMMCADFATSDTRWQDRSIGAGSVLYAEGRIYLHGEKGDIALIEATPEAYREKGRFSPPNQPDHAANRSQAWCYPVIADGKLYIRDLNMLWCFDIRDASAKH